MNILSYGGGVQTIAMCVLVAHGKLQKPDAVIAADTGREMPTTWEYADEIAKPLLASVGLELHIAKHEMATVDLYAHNGDLLVPAFTATGKLPTFCSSKWKARVVYRYAKQILGASTDQTHWIGFSLDEVKRIKSIEGRRFPLVEMMLTKADCEHIITAAGLPLPKKSRCWMCPHQHNEEWREVQAMPELWRQAVELDNEIRENDNRDGLFLHADRTPLDMADITANDRKTLSNQCGMGLCFV